MPKTRLPIFSSTVQKCITFIVCVCVGGGWACGGRLAEIAHALLKLAPYDTLTMESRGLRRYITEMLPITDWSAEAVRPALILILKRLDRMFNKIHKMPTLRCARPQALCSRSVIPSSSSSSSSPSPRVSLLLLLWSVGGAGGRDVSVCTGLL